MCDFILQSVRSRPAQVGDKLAHHAARGVVDRTAACRRVGAAGGIDPYAGGGAVRGVILHKIMEEFVTGELKADADAVRERSRPPPAGTRRLADARSGYQRGRTDRLAHLVLAGTRRPPDGLGRRGAGLRPSRRG